MPSEGLPRPPAEHRLHPASLIFSIGAAARRLLLPGIIAFYLARGGFLEFFIMLFFIVAVVSAVARYLSYRYRLEGDELVIREGIVTRNERHVPYARIQNIDLVQNVLHRLLGVAEVRVETAGGESPEAVLRVLSLDAVDRMRSLVFLDRPASGPRALSAASAERPEPRMSPLLHHLPSREVVLFGLISNKGMVVVAAMLGIVWQFDVEERIQEWLSPEQLQRLQALRPVTESKSVLSAVLLGAGLLIALVVLMRLLSIAWAFLKFYGFRLQRHGEDLRTEQGLLTRITKTIPRHRIQVLATGAGPLHRLFGRSSVQVQTAGSTPDGDGGSTGRLWLAPLIRNESISALLRQALPEVSFEDVPWQPVSARAWVRLFRKSLIFLLLPLAAGVWGIGAWAVLPMLPLAVLAYVNARLYARHAAYALVPGAVFYRSGWWVRRSSVVLFNRIQSVNRIESPFDRRNDMASVQVDTAGAGRIGHGVHVRYLDAAVAESLRARLSAEAERTSFRW